MARMCRGIVVSHSPPGVLFLAMCRCTPCISLCIICVVMMYVPNAATLQLSA